MCGIAGCIRFAGLRPDERGLGTQMVEFPEDPSIVGALGAALFAADGAAGADLTAFE